jgi:hypothetical protein
LALEFGGWPEDGSGQQRADEFAVDVGEAVVASLELEGQAFVIQAEQVEPRGIVAPGLSAKSTPSA